MDTCLSQSRKYERKGTQLAYLGLMAAAFNVVYTESVLLWFMFV